MAQGWGLVVPVKLLALAKTRLSAYGDAGRADLALAFADDVLRAATRCDLVRQVLVVTDDARAGRALARPGVRVVPDTPAAGLNPALAYGAGLLRTADPALGVAALAGDLPCLTATDLAEVLAAVRSRGLVADATGVGTTVLAAGVGHELRPAYGPGSRERHRLAGYVELDAAAGLRRDVDTPEDLRAALRLGAGPSTRAAAARLEPVACRA